MAAARGLALVVEIEPVQVEGMDVASADLVDECTGLADLPGSCGEQA